MQEAMTALAADTDVDAELAIKDRYSWGMNCESSLAVVASMQLLLTGPCHLLYSLSLSSICQLRLI